MVIGYDRDTYPGARRIAAKMQPIQHSKGSSWLQGRNDGFNEASDMRGFDECGLWVLSGCEGTLA